MLLPSHSRATAPTSPAAQPKTACGTVVARAPSPDDELVAAAPADCDALLAAAEPLLAAADPLLAAELAAPEAELDAELAAALPELILLDAPPDAPVALALERPGVVLTPIPTPPLVIELPAVPPP